MKSGTKVHFSSARSNWATPQAFFDELDKEFNIAWDVCAEHHTAKCPGYWTKDDDGLSRTWEGVCYMNAPYGREITKWGKKAYESSIHGVTVVCLLPSRTDTRWWHDYVMFADEIRFVKGRLKFDGHKNSAPFPSAVVIFKGVKRTAEDARHWALQNCS